MNRMTILLALLFVAACDEPAGPTPDDRVCLLRIAPSELGPLCNGLCDSWELRGLTEDPNQCGIDCREEGANSHPSWVAWYVCEAGLEVGDEAFACTDTLGESFQSYGQDLQNYCDEAGLWTGNKQVYGSYL